MLPDTHPPHYADPPNNPVSQLATLLPLASYVFLLSLLFHGVLNHL